jgi:plasmid stability protein
MTTTLNLPDDLAGAVQRRAAAGGRDVAAEVVDLVRKGLAASERASDAAAAVAPIFGKDPVTGLPLISGAPDAPIGRMTAEQIYALIEQTQEREDVERLGIPLRR